MNDSLRYFEREVAVARRGHGGKRLVRGRGVVGAAFVHRTSRAGDPQLHTHVLIANAVQDETGRWSARDGRRVYRHARTAGFLYQARLRAELTDALGVDWMPVHRGAADIVGFSRPVLRAFSRRRVEIEAALREAGLSSRAAADVATLQTRRAKDRRSAAEDLRPEWIERAGQLGIDRTAISRLTGLMNPARLTDGDLDAIAEYMAGPEGLTKHSPTFTRADALRLTCELLPTNADVSVERIERMVDRLLKSPEVIPVLRPPYGLASDFRYSTLELLRLESRILAAAEGDTDIAVPVATKPAQERAIRERPTLAREQAELVRQVTDEPRRVVVVVGKAGTGKTYALDAAREAWERSEIPVVGAAVSNRAARELQDGSGIPSTSLASLLLRARRSGLPPGSVVVLDEASMAGTRQLAELLEHVRAARGKLVMVGDDRQLPAVEAGGAFATLAHRAPTVRLTENRRQVEAWERSALDLVREGSVGDALREYAKRGRITLGRDPEATRTALVRDWWSNGGPTEGVMIAFRRVDVADLNARARSLMAATGQLEEASLEVAGLEFAVGDRVLLRRNDRRLGVANGDRATITTVDANERRLVVEVGARRAVLDSRYLDAAGPTPVMHGYAITGHAAQGITVPRAYVLGSDALYREWGYVAMSRGRQLNQFYVVGRGSLERDEFAPVERSTSPLDAVRAALARSRAERLASDDQSRRLE
jgi:hypothetical protein